MAQHMHPLPHKFIFENVALALSQILHPVVEACHAAMFVIDLHAITLSLGIIKGMEREEAQASS